MTLEEVIAEAKVMFDFDRIEVANNEVVFVHKVYVDAEQEAHDVIDDVRIDLQDWMTEIGLEIYDMDNDSDSIWGKIRVVSTAKEG